MTPEQRYAIEWECTQLMAIHGAKRRTEFPTTRMKGSDA